MTKHKSIYLARNENRNKGSVKPRPFIGLLILDVINWFMFGHELHIYYVLGFRAPSRRNMFIQSDNNNFGVDQPVRPRSLFSVIVIHCLESVLFRRL